MRRVQGAIAPGLYRGVAGKARHRTWYIMLHLVSSSLEYFNWGVLITRSRTETALDALYRPPRDPSLRTAERSGGTVATVCHDSAVDMDTTQPRFDLSWTRESPPPNETRRRRRKSMAPGAIHRPRRLPRLQRESLVTESSHAPSTRRRLARLGWVSKWMEELV